MNEIKKFRMGSKFKWKNDVYIIARTSDYKRKDLLHFQLISITDGNRFSNYVITHDVSIHDGLNINDEELFYLLYEDKELFNKFIEGYISTDDPFEFSSPGTKIKEL